MSIRVSNVTKLYGEQKALNNVSFEVNSGEVIGFLGPNGAGKSTMMKIITGYIPQSEGEVEVCGIDVRTDSLEVRKKVGYLPEHNPLYTDMYVREYLLFVAGLHKAPKSRVDEMIVITGLTPEQHKKIGQLSKGYRQRVGLAQAMIHDPEVLILDEPTTGLDPNQLVDIRKLIREIGKEKTVMLSTHIMQEVEAVCDRVIIINKGVIAADQKTSEMQNASGTVILNIEFDAEVSLSGLKKIAGVRRVQHVEGGQYLIECSEAKDVRSDVFKFAVQQNRTILQSQQQKAKLEDIFRTLTGNAE
ncbi:gliding motility-associated ABC transporter ATP-binding subunit GldA [Phaeocystidibacter marisrubri]|uniref:Gliding motility-associated ABC transporter ATP-binding subunit GldA n=1 Tax=Phaeocystidibacter marisrubri TaxID=1577780 RepID=A0A6L3ZFA6_9FLAO|nr:gliding motility-associated ABC transporter ATP-binding subunit GldA [Phaeocystidibacter marisrubri]KAB2816097.1 gliding motility-associated ABC transporter ATP-binding subunit GldA [Phaeocystidibacter marisrubri]GGH67310.1 gliding motility-associated ABC transporter ATP-binding subunit GldA [Phaeocystidibacter marisrubri]